MKKSVLYERGSGATCGNSLEPDSSRVTDNTELVPGASEVIQVGLGVVSEERPSVREST
jgi:hypothetical protein